ncbi:Ger(x)C family spore germination protein [Paenibacillus sp. 1781tsa1]|uniref:Ger(x)C family spore germination protein n=1 Tax=Paenibacillus sp. 1781tsa1 TaxID=2953810 RepID=UPI0020A027F0|nr:Ger(x)C family spore germination protein [Paenibacillus sp. 1781tsa1]MCP1186789.1 Ger(x)C family spore germination protein [Paenibacillus sp. 1781tsa1]
MIPFRILLRVASALCILLLISGCWSSREIEDLSLYVGLGIDVGKETAFEKDIAEQGGTYPKKNYVTATVQIAPGFTNSQSSQQSGSPSSGKTSYSNEQLSGDSMLQIFRQFALRRDRPLIGHHLKVIVVSKDIAKKYGLDQLLDFVLRDNDIRPNCLVLISHHSALDVLTSQDPSRIPAFYLTGITNNSYLSNKILDPVLLSKLDAQMQSGSSFLLQNVLNSHGEDKFSGGSIFDGKTTKFIGELSQTDLEGLSWLNSKKKGGVLKTHNKQGFTVVYEIKKKKVKIIPKVVGNDISFHVKTESEGWLMEDWRSPEEEEKGEYLRELEKDFAELAEQQIRQVLYKLQHTYKVDVADFRDSLRIKEPKTWKKVKDDWDKIFSTVPITYEVKTTITNPGSSTE